MVIMSSPMLVALQLHASFFSMYLAPPSSQLTQEMLDLEGRHMATPIVEPLSDFRDPNWDLTQS